MEFHDETLDEALDWVNESMKTFPDQPTPEWLVDSQRELLGEDYSQADIAPGLSHSDIEDILAGFDSGPSIRRPVPIEIDPVTGMPRKKKSPQDELDQMMIDFGM